MNTQNDNSYAAYIGIDWANSKHDICIQSTGNDQREFSQISHQVEKIEEWAQSMYQRFGGKIAVAVELSKGPIVYALQKYDFFRHPSGQPNDLGKIPSGISSEWSKGRSYRCRTDIGFDLSISGPFSTTQSTKC